MKILIKKFAAILVITIILWPATAMAQNDNGGEKKPDQETIDAMNDTKENWHCPPEMEELEYYTACINDCVEKDKDGKCISERTKYIITILEESIVAPGSKPDKIKSCTRLTLQEKCIWKGTGDEPSESNFKFGTYTKLVEGTKCPDNAVFCEKVTVIFTPLEKGGTGLIETYVGLIYRWAATLAGIVCILIMIVSGIQISAAGEDAQAVESAKKRIFQSLTGLVILFLSAFILYMINPGFFRL